ncbi:MAG: hypothetical protein ABJB17_00825 [Burkholderiales bacterium]
MLTQPPDTTASGERWQAAGVRHAVLLRALPALRHDVASPISVMQMTVSLLQRKLTVEPADASYCAHRVAVLEQQIGALNDALRWLFDWGIGVADVPVTRTQLVSRCVGLLRPLWGLEGVAIQVDSALQQQSSTAEAAGRSPESSWPRQAALRYLLLAALCYVHDRSGGLTGIRVTPDRHDALLLQCLYPHDEELGSTPLTCMAEAQPVPICIDAAALACLADDLGYLVRFNQDGVWLQLADSRRLGDQDARIEIPRNATR